MAFLLAQHTVDAPASPEAAWKLWTTPANWPRFYPHLSTAACVGGQLRPGATLELRPQGRGQSQVFVVGQVGPGNQVVLNRRLLFADLRLTHRVDPSPLGARLHLKAQLSGPLAWLHAQLRRRAWRGFVPALLRALAREAQKG